MSATRRYTEKEHQLTHILVTELLAYQFCSPVQWVKVQDAIFRDIATERLIEIGPTDTLTNMAKTTLGLGDMASHDIARGLQRHLLSLKKDSDSIYYRPAEADSSSTITPASQKVETSVASKAPEVKPLQDSPTPISAPRTLPSTAIPDKPLEVYDVVACIVAGALKKLPGDVTRDHSIKALCGGRSTVQNEIVGDLMKEFGALPDQPEDLELDSLGKYLAAAGKGDRLGPCTSALVSKVASTKMPSGTGISAVRQYLQTRWSLKTGLENRVLLEIIHRQPKGRLADEAELHGFLDGVSQEVLQSVGIDLARLDVGSGGGAADGQASMLTGEAVAMITNQQRSQDETLFNLYAKRLGRDVRSENEQKHQKKAELDALQERLDGWAAEMGDQYEQGIVPVFDVRKLRRFDSSWNWVLQDFIRLINPDPSSNADEGDVDHISRERLSKFAARSTTALLNAIRFANSNIKNGELANLGRETQQFLLELEQSCETAVSVGFALFKHFVRPSMPILDIDDQGNATVRIIFRQTLPILRQPSLVPGNVDLEHVKPLHNPVIRGVLTPPESEFNGDRVGARPANNDTSCTSSSQASGSTWTPTVQTKGPLGWQHNEAITETYRQWFTRASSDGISLHGKKILITGAGKNSIGTELVIFSIAAGAQVLVTTSSFSKQTVAYYQSLYEQHGAGGSLLLVIPFNGGSRQDVESVVKYIYNDLEWDLDYIIPFAAVSEAGRAVDNIDDRSEIAHRIMLTNLLRLLGAVQEEKARRGIDTHPTHAMLPLSPNHGVFGQDGLYAESKIGLEALMNKWWSENWQDYLSLCGIVIGWTRGTGLMNNNDVLAAGLEEVLGITTFSTEEMAWHILGLMDPELATITDVEPIKVDLSGGMSSSTTLKSTLDQIQQQVRTECDIKRALFKESQQERLESGDTPPTTHALQLKARLRVGKTVLPDYREEVEPLAQKLHGMVDLDRVPVIVGVGEIGACGSARTRWEAECQGVFSLEGCLELAWMMGLISYQHGVVQGQDYCGWVDKETGSPITDADVKAKYEEYITQHIGIRKIERHGHDLGEPEQTETLHEVVIAEDLEPLEVSIETATDLQRAHGKNVVVEPLGQDQALVAFRAGATLYIPKASSFHHAIGSQMPSGWDARRYGISEEIIHQVDPVTLYALVATAEALLSAGIIDPFDFYKHVTVAEVGNAIGSGLGGQQSLHAMFKQRYHERQVQKDILAETFINTTAAWINMLLLGSSGPIRTPVGACATSLESVDTGVDLIRSGKSKVVIVGGSETLEREVAHGFANMQATINADEDAAAGREADEASRPTASSRAGFVEGEGCAIQIMTTASLAIEMGLPIRAVIALSHTAADKIGRSVPAPGQGLLTIAAEKPALFPSTLLDLSYRRRQLEHRRQQIQESSEMELTWLREKQSLSQDAKDQVVSEEQTQEWSEQIRQNAKRAFRDAQYGLGNDFWRDEESISPLRGALAVWGLTVDDLSFASLHGTSTKKNDINETAVVQRTLQALGRQKGNLLPCIAQKSLLGHAKAAAGGFALNGCVQTLTTGVVPGNRNADNIDAALADRDLLFFPSRTYQATEPMRAFSVTSFGFGQKGAQVIGVHPRYLFAHLHEDEYEVYRSKVDARMVEADQALQNGLSNGSIVKLKEKSVYNDGDVETALLGKLEGLGS